MKRYNTIIIIVCVLIGISGLVAYVLANRTQNLLGATSAFEPKNLDRLMCGQFESKIASNASVGMITAVHKIFYSSQLQSCMYSYTVSYGDAKGADAGEKLGINDIAGKELWSEKKDASIPIADAAKILDEKIKTYQ